MRSTTLMPPLGGGCARTWRICFVQGGLGDFAFLDVHDQAVVGADEPDVQALFEFVPLTADHDAVAIAVRLRARNHRGDHGRVETADALEQIGRSACA